MKVMTRLRVLLVEDDHVQARLITETLERTFPNIKVDPIRTEAEFRSNIGAIASKPPDIVIMDVMLRWTDPGLDLPNPPEPVREGGYDRAGIRCVEMLVAIEATRNIPVILFTVLSPGDFQAPPNADSVAYLSKESEPEELISRVRGILNREQ